MPCVAALGVAGNRTSSLKSPGRATLVGGQRKRAFFSALSSCAHTDRTIPPIRRDDGDRSSRNRCVERGHISDKNTRGLREGGPRRRGIAVTRRADYTIGRTERNVFGNGWRRIP